MRLNLLKPQEAPLGPPVQINTTKIMKLLNIESREKTK
jgi:hypothetical protein